MHVVLGELGFRVGVENLGFRDFVSLLNSRGQGAHDEELLRMVGRVVKSKDIQVHHEPCKDGYQSGLSPFP